VSREGEAAEAEASVGRYLARQRKLRGVSLDELASATRIPRRSIERLEEGAFDHDSDGFSRGFVRTVADSLGLDAEEAVLRLLGEPADAGVAPAFRSEAYKRWAIVASLVVFVIAGGLGIWSLWGAGEGGGEGARPTSTEVFLRRDVVRELAASQRDAFVQKESLDSRREGHRD